MSFFVLLESGGGVGLCIGPYHQLLSHEVSLMDPTPPPPFIEPNKGESFIGISTIAFISAYLDPRIPHLSPIFVFDIVQ